MARKAISFAGIGKLSLLGGVFAHDVTTRDLRAIERELVESGEVVVVDVEGWKGSQFVLARDLNLLVDVANARVPKGWKPIGPTTEDEVTLLSPLDPVLGRRRAKLLFDFEYRWEIYKKQELVQFGRYTMPILWGERFAGRIDPRLDRVSNTLVVNGIWLEDATDGRRPEFLDALREGVRSLMLFLGADRVDATTVTDAKLRRPIVSLNPRRRR